MRKILFPKRFINYFYTKNVQKFNQKSFLNLREKTADSIKFNKFILCCFSTKNNNNHIKFLPFCQIINSLEKESSNLKKQEIYVNYLLQSISSETNKDKKEIFEEIGNIIKLTVPSLFIVEESENNKTTTGELIRSQYNYQSILEKFAKENLLDGKIEPSENVKSLAKKLGGIHNLLSNYYQIANKINNENSLMLNVNDIIMYKSEVNLSTGNNSSEAKIKLFSEILGKCCDKLEIYYISRLFTNQMSCGMSTKSIIKCLKTIEKNLENNKIDKNFFKELVEYLEENIFKFSIGLNGISEVDANDENNELNDSGNKEALKVGKYVDLSLCRPGVNLNALLKILKEKKYDKILVEIKFDGERSQIHFDGTTLKMGSRKFENQIILYKSLHENIMKNITEYNENNKESEIKNFILDGEIICYVENNSKENPIKILDFQELRKKKESQKVSEIKYVFVAFDILVYNDIQIFKLPMERRKELLMKLFLKKLNSITVENGEIISYTDDLILKEKIREYYNYAKRINCEGLILKFIGKDTQYEFGKRKWLKLKSLEELSCESLDLIPIAAFAGKGIKNNKVYNSFLMASYNPIDKIYHSVCKVGTGFEQEELEKLTELLNKNEIKEPLDNYNIPSNLKPDCFFLPDKIWEIGFDKFTESNTYLVNLLPEITKGFSLRFPRFVRERNDKKLEDSSTLEYLKELILTTLKK